jgi:two-component system C4-dicarboxylate transport response regulator DctD
LVGDDAAWLRSNARALARNGALVETARSCERAIERLRSVTFDVVVNSLGGREIGRETEGREFLRAVRAHDVQVPVILMNGPSTAGSVARALEQGAFRYLSKPVDGAELWYLVVRAARLCDRRMEVVTIDPRAE